MKHILSKFTIYLQSMEYSKASIDSYISDINLFLNFLKRYLNIAQINIFTLSTVKEQDILAFLSYLNYNKNNTAESRNRRLASIKIFYKWLFNLKYSTFKDKENPTRYIKFAIEKERIPHCLDIKQARKLQTVFNRGNSKNYLRNNTIIILILHTALRISSLMNANISDLNFDSKTLKVVVKGNKEHIVFLNDTVIEKLKEYLNTRTDNNDALFVTSTGKRMSKMALQSICKKALKLIGIDEDNYSAHTLRHTAASIIYQKTGDLLITRDFLGHASITSTEIYTHIYLKFVKEAVDNNPLNSYCPQRKQNREGEVKYYEI